MILKNEDKAFTPAPMGLHKGVCVDVIDLGMLQGFGGKMQHKVRFYFELPHALMEDGRPFLVVRMFTATLAETGNLAPFLAKWRGGVPFAQNEAIDLDQLIGKPALLVITHNAKDGKTFANIDSILPCAEPVRPSGHYKRKEPQSQQKQFGSGVQRQAPQPAQPSPMMGHVTPANPTAFQSLGPLPTTAELINVPPTSRADEQFREGALGITGKPATQEQKDKFLNVLAPIKESAAKYFNSLGALGNDQTLDQLPLQYCPATKTQFDNIMGSIQSFIDSQPNPPGDDVQF